MNDIIPNYAKREWVNCPICGEPDMRREEDHEGNALILCVNHACASNGGSNADAILKPKIELPLDRQIARWGGEAAQHWWVELTDEERANTEKLPPASLFTLGFQCARANPRPSLP